MRPSCGERRVQSAPVACSLGEEDRGTGGPATVRPKSNGKRGRGWAPEASWEVALSSAGNAGTADGGRGASVEAGGPGSAPAGSGDGEEKPAGTWPQLTWENAGSGDGNPLEVTGWGKYYFSAYGRTLREGLMSGRQSPWNGFHLYQCFTDVCAAPLFFFFSFLFCLECM